MKSTKAETVTYTASSDGVTITQTAQVTFEAGTMESLKVSAAVTQTAGVPFDVTVTAQDHYGNIVTNYTGTVHLSTNNGNSPGGTALSLPQDYTFTLADGGTYTFSSGVTLYNAGASSLTVTDTVYNTVTGTIGNITVNAGTVSADQSTVTASKSTVTADDNDNSIITVILRDIYGNLVSGKTVTLSQGSGSSEISTSSAVSGTDGTVTYAVNTTIAESVTYTAAADGVTLTQTAGVTFTPGKLEGFKISVMGTQTAGVPFSVTVTARDRFGNTNTDYTGTVSLSTDNGNSPGGEAPSLPQNYAFTAEDAGTHTFSGLTLFNADISSLTVTDTVYNTIYGTKGNITVNPGPVNPGLSTVTAGKSTVTANNTDSSTITVILKDAYDNPIAGKPVNLTKEDTIMATATSDTAGTVTFTVKSTKAEEVSYTAMADGVTITQDATVTFTAGPVDAAKSTVVAGKSPVAADGIDSSTITVTLKDAYENPVSGKTVILAGSGNSQISPANTMSAADGTVTFTVRNTTAEMVTYTVTADGITVAHVARINFTPPHTVSVAANPPAGGTVSGGGIYGEGVSVTVTAAVNSGYIFVNWTEGTIVVSNNATYTLILGTADRTLAANFSLIHSSGGGQTTNPPKPEVDSNGNVAISVSPTLDISTGTASTEVNETVLIDAFEKAAVNQEGVKTVAIDIPKVKGATTYTPTLPANFLTSGDVTKKIEINTDIASVSVPGNMLQAADAAGAEKVSLTIALGDKSKLPKDIREQLGNRPVTELSLKIDGQSTFWSNNSAPVKVSIPYTPTADELKDHEHITVWYIDGTGKVESVPSGRYDPSTGKVTFTTTHFSKYAVAFVQKFFSDISRYGWAKKQIEVMASKGIINGASKDTFAPAANITRADYLILLVKTLGLTADFDSNFDDVKPGTYYYEAAGIAKKLGIAAGSENNRFNPQENISRQDMMVLTARALEKFKSLKDTDNATVLNKFSDKDDIAEYSINSIATLVREGLIAGSGNTINPQDSTTRAEAAVFLYRIYNKY